MKVLKPNATHTLKTCTIKVKEYHPDIEIIPDGYDNSKPGFSVPESCYISVFEQPLIEFITCSPNSKKIINDRLFGTYAEVDWNSSQLENNLKVICCLKYSTNNVHVLAKNWLHNTRELFDQIRDQFTFEKIDVWQKYWPQYLTSYTELFGDGMNNDIEDAKIILDENCFCVTVVGLKPFAGPIAEKMNNILESLEKKTIFQKNSITEMLSMLKPHQIELLTKTNLLPTLEKDHEVQFSKDASYATLDIIGLPYNVREAKIKVLESVSAIVQRSIKCSSNMAKLASTDQSTKEALNNALIAKDDQADFALATFYVGENCLNVLAPSDIEVQKAYTRIEKYARSINYHIDELPYRDAIREENWHKLKGRIILDASLNASLVYSQDYQSLIIHSSQFTTTLVTVDENYEKLTFDGTSAEAAAECVRTYLDSKATFLRFVPLSLGLGRYFHSYGRNCLDEAESAFKNFNVRLQIQTDNDQYGIKVTGLKGGCESVFILLETLNDVVVNNNRIEHGSKGDLLEKLEAKLNRTKFTVDDKILCRFLHSDAGCSFIMDVEKQQKVIIDKINTENLIDKFDKLHKVCIVRVKNIDIACALSDIATMDVDAIVNPANEHLSLGSGVAGSIKRLGNT